VRGAAFGPLAALLFVLACAPAAAPTPATGAAPPAAPPSGAAAPAASAPTSAADYRQQVIDGARAEGEVTATLHTSWPPEGIQQLEAAIEREYGVRLKINFQPIGNYTQRAAQFLAEVEANATPSYDVYQSSDTTSATLRRANAVEVVNWAPLLPAGTPPESIVADGAHLVVYTDHTGLMTDPAVVSDADVPRSIRDLGNPKWHDRVIVFATASNYLPWVIRLGREETLAAVRAAVRNGAITDTFPGMLTRFAAKEYPLVTIGVTFHHLAQARGIASRFTPLDFSYNTDHHVSVARRAVHPNAAKLLAAVLARPEGQRIEAEHIGVGSRYYADTREYQLEQDALAAGFPSFTWADNPDGLAFALSPDGEALLREIDQILKGG
jgi:ABC-type Fe3+ transport system substrate-binding protein